MKDVFARLAADFFSTIVFLALYLITGNVLLATGVAIAGAVAQVIYARVKGRQLGFMTYASVALVFVLGLGTIAVALTGDLKLWALYVSVVLIGAKVAAFAIQYVAFRLLVINRIRAAAIGHV